MLANLEEYRVVLLSKSPRRKDLLKALNIPFEVIPVDVEENYPDELKKTEIPVFLAKKKANAFQLGNRDFLIAADTIVIVENQVLGKPKDRNDAIEMLSSLSGKTHRVITGVCMKTKQQEKVFSVVSKVTFSDISLSEIIYYVDNNHPYDKAGSYGVQDWIGVVAVEAIEGSFYNIMGLPIHRLYAEMKNW